MGLVAFKQCYVIGRHIKFERMYWLLEDLWQFSRTQAEAEGLEDCAWQAKYFTLFFWIIGTSSYLFYLACPIYIWTVNKQRSNGSDYERELLLNCRYWFDPSPTPIFEMTFTWEAIALFSSGNCIVGLDGSMMTMIMHVVGQFRLINVRLNSIGHALRNSASSAEKFDAWAEIKNCAKHHQRMLRIADYVDSLLGPVVFAQFLTAAMGICLNGYAVMNGDIHDVTLFKYIFLLGSATVQLVCYCWPGEMLIQESKQIAKTVYYDIPWFALPYNRQRDLSLVIIRSERECKITAMGFQVMSLQKLTEVFNAAASYMALLRSMNEKERMID